MKENLLRECGTGSLNINEQVRRISVNELSSYLNYLNRIERI